MRARLDRNGRERKDDADEDVEIRRRVISGSEVVKQGERSRCAHDIINTQFHLAFNRNSNNILRDDREGVRRVARDFREKEAKANGHNACTNCSIWREEKPRAIN